MALRVWLPLNKDLRQQGLSATTYTQNTGTAISSGGKLGSCLTATSNATVVINLSSLATMLANGKTYSLACWAKITNNVTNGWVIKLGTNNCGLWWAASEARWVWNENDNGKRCANPTISADTNWHHLCIVVDKTVTNKITTKQYVDGALAAGYPGSTWDCSSHSQPAGTTITISPYVAQLNDIRLYDHCLSQMEVKELAKGLVLHYPLNRQGWGQENLLLNTNDLTKWSKESACTITLENDGYYHIVSTNTSGNRYGIYYELTFPEVGTYTLSADVRTDWRIGFAASSSFGWTANTIIGTGNAQRVMQTITTTSENNKCRIYINSQMNSNGVVTNSTYIKNIKVEKGSITTPWCPNSSDELATTIGLNSTTEYDCSGFCNNGDKTGTFTYTSDTPKYLVSTTLTNNTTKIHISNLTTTGFANSYTFTWWGKTSTFSGVMQWGFSDGIRLNGIYNGTLWNTGDGSENPLYNPGTTTQVSAPTTNVWHHFAMVGDGSTCKVYKDGVLWAQAKTYKAISGTSIYINGWTSATNYSHSAGFSMSDFRVYATALSADDVKSLYQNSAYIDSSGNVYGAVHVEA